MCGPTTYPRMTAEVRGYVQREWNGRGDHVLAEIARAARDTAARRRGPAIRGFLARLADGIAELVAAPAPGRD